MAVLPTSLRPPQGKRGPVVDLLTSRASMADPPPDVARQLLQQYAGADGGAFLPFDALPVQPSLHSCASDLLIRIGRGTRMCTQTPRNT